MKKITITIKQEDVGHRDLNIIAIIGRKKGPHKNHKKHNNKTKCRKKVINE